MLACRIGSNGAFGRHTAQVHDGVDAGQQAVHGRGIGQVGLHQFFALLRRAQIGPVRHAQHPAVGLELVRSTRPRPPAAPVSSSLSWLHKEALDICERL